MIKLHRITDTGHSALEVGSLVIVYYLYSLYFVGDGQNNCGCVSGGICLENGFCQCPIGYSGRYCGQREYILYIIVK